MKQVVSRKELMEIFHISRTHLIRKLKEKNVNPIEANLNSSKKLYLLSEVEEAFGIKVGENGEAKKEDKSERNFISDVDDILSS